MKKYFIVILSSITLLSFLSCTCFYSMFYDPGDSVSQKWFIDSILRNPDDIISIIDNSFYYDQDYKEKILFKDSLEPLKSYIKSISNEGYEYKYYKYYNYYPFQSSGTDTNFVIFYEEIKVKGNNGLFINFYFYTKQNKWVLGLIDKWEKTELERQLDFESSKRE